MQAICFKCGSVKSNPLKLCSECHTAPVTEEERVISLCLSIDCIKPENLAKAAKYIRKKKRPPGFHEKVKVRARKLLKSMPAVSDASIELSASFFDIGEMIQDDDIKVKVHAIGKPSHDTQGTFADRNQPDNRKPTYHVEEWTVGQQITEHEHEANSNTNGELFIWYRWLENKWVWKFVSQPEFERLRQMERS